MESHVFNIVGTVDQRIELWNYDTIQFETFDSRLATAADSLVEVTPGGDPTRFVHPLSGGMRARIRNQNSLPFWVFRTASLYIPFRTNVDRIFWSVTP